MQKLISIEIHLLSKITAKISQNLKKLTNGIETNVKTEKLLQHFLKPIINFSQPIWEQT